MEGLRVKTSDTGGYFAIIGPHNWSVSADGQQLTWNGYALTRVSGSGVTYVGVWSGTDGDPMEIAFGDDGTYQWRWVNENESVYGHYVVSGNILTAYEKRGDMTATGNRLTMDTVWGRSSGRQLFPQCRSLAY
ncbi:protein of unknown function [Nitrospira japonica]|uniref:Uncharacterized protein n=1 Tax=Nitrospira japonica TaxID=1325564 RepID=A0A1W1I4Z3_9BACT|nr:protein of unknown function [Nitrospira japonica]